MNKSKTKSAFVIKLTNETAQKLAEASHDTISVNKPLQVQEAAQLDVNNKNVNIQNKELPEPSQEKFGDNESKNADEPSHTIIEKSKPEFAVHNDNKSWGKYTPYITYEGEEAIYTDPNTRTKYSWSNKTNSWEAKTSGEQSYISKRVYTYEDDTHIYTEADGSKFFWDIDKKAWIPKVDDDFLAYYQMSYGFIENTSKNESESEKKEKDKDKETAKECTDSVPVGSKRKQDPQWFDATDETNTKVYVSNLPLDITEEEFVNLMQKCGLVMRDPSTQNMKIKLYTDKEQNCFKGDALCTYIKIESVDLALKILDGSVYKGQKIKVERAHFQLKGEYNPSLKPKKKKKKELAKIKRIQEKLFDWRPEKILGERSKNERVVIIKNLFDPSDFDKEVQLILDYQQDLREECAKCGEVRKVIIYDRHPEGVAQVTMKEPEQADSVVQLTNGRWFGKRKLTAEIWDGRTKYRIAETDADISKRVEKWENFLEQGKEADTKTNNDSEDGKSTVKDESEVIKKSADTKADNDSEDGKSTVKDESEVIKKSTMEITDVTDVKSEVEV